MCVRDLDLTFVKEAWWLFFNHFWSEKNNSSKSKNQTTKPSWVCQDYDKENFHSNKAPGPVPTKSVIYLPFDQLDVACDFEAEQIVVDAVDVVATAAAVVAADVVVVASHSDSQWPMQKNYNYPFTYFHLKLDG